jgi:ribosomal protein S18 acetylase RimI-like enzyme
VSPDNVSIERTGLGGVESALRPLLREYFAVADRKATERFDDLGGRPPAEPAESDLDRLRSPAVDDPLILARTGSGAESPSGDDAGPTSGSDVGRIVGFVQLKRLFSTDAEMKRLYVVPERRGEGIGRDLAERAVAAARADGFETLRLGVGPYLDPARSLYESLGFRYTDPYDGTQCPEAIHDEWRFMRLDLDGREG